MIEMHRKGFDGSFNMASRFKIILPLFILILSLPSCIRLSFFTSNRFLIKHDVAAINGETGFRLDLGKFANNWPEFEFAMDGSPYIFCWWAPSYDPDRIRIGEILVLNFAGEAVDATENEGKILRPEFVPLFTNAISLQKWNKFIKGFDAWGFSDDGNYGVRLFEPKLGGDWSVELCSLRDEGKCLWKIDRLEHPGLFPIAEFIQYEAKNAVLLAFNVRKAYIFSQETGALLDSFEYGPKDTKETLRNRAWKFNVWCGRDLEGCGMDFSSSNLAYNGNKRLLASGDFNSQRVRIISIDSHEMILELNSECNPKKPWGGSWDVTRLAFSKSGKYLVVEYDYQSLIRGKAIRPTEIYDTDTWQCCWFENSEEIMNVTLSPDEKMILFRRGRILEVGPFVPAPGSCGHGC